MLEWLTTKVKTNKNLLLYSFISCGVFVLAAHAFCFFNLNLSHDYLNEFYALDGLGWKISIGRFMAPLVNILLGQFTVLPWLSGIIMIISISICIFLITKMFNFKKHWQIILLSGLFSTSLSMAALTASFMQDVAADMIALLLAITSAYQWDKLNDKFSFKTFFISIITMCLSLGCYQGYLSITITLILMKSIKNLLDKQSSTKTIKQGLIGIAIIALGSISYFTIANIVSTSTGYQLSSNTTNSLSNVWDSDQNILERFSSTYTYTIWGVFAPSLSAVPQKTNLLHFSESTIQIYTISLINILTLLFYAIITIHIILNKKINSASKIIYILLIATLPLAMNITHFLSGSSHILMHYAFILFYLLLLVFINYTNIETKSKFLKNFGKLLVPLTGIIILINIELSNALYIKKDLEKQSTVATITRILTNIESQDDYIYGETKICLIGDSQIQSGVKDDTGLSMLFGAGYNSSITYQDTYNAYFHNVLQYKANMCNPSEIEKIKANEEFSKMGTFPNKDSLRTINNIIVVKMSN